MTDSLCVTIGQHSDRGRKDVNQDFHGAFVPPPPQLDTKGIVLAVADGVSSSAVSREAAESAVKSFVQDYYCTSDAWTVNTSAQRVIKASNSWLHAQTQRSQFRYERDKGYVCTFSAVVLKSNTAHLFHVGDGRIYHLRDGQPECLTEAHRTQVSAEQSFLARALGLDRHVEIDYLSVPIQVGDLLLLATDGIFDGLKPGSLPALIGNGPDLDAAARRIVAAALEGGSQDNLTVQLVRIDAVPKQQAGEVQRRAGELQLPPMLQARMSFDGFEILRQIHASSRSHIFLARDEASDVVVALKTPSMDLREDPVYRERFLLEEWVARRVDSAHVLKPHPRSRPQHYLYVVMEYLEGQTLTQWMRDHPRPDLETVRDIVEQVARGLRAFHRKEMLHQDLRPENIMIDRQGTVKIIDFGSTRIAGMAEALPVQIEGEILGTHQYTAPEYFIGEPGTPASDLFSLAVIAYQMLTGQLPYGAEVARATSRAAQNRLVYRSAVTDDNETPAWVDDALRRALHPSPLKRQTSLSEFITDLKQPSQAFMARARPSLIERDPLRFWKGLSIALGFVVVGLLDVIRQLM